MHFAPRTPRIPLPSAGRGARHASPGRAPEADSRLGAATVWGPAIATLALAACQGAPRPGAVSDAVGCAAPATEPELDPWGGDIRVQLEATGFFATASLCDRWWLTTPEGHPFWSLGVNAATPDGDYEEATGSYPYGEAVDVLYADDEAWAEAEALRLRSWGFNTAAAWSQTDLLAPWLAVTPILYLSGSDWLSGEVDDWFDPAWVDGVALAAAEQVAGWEGDPRVLGWFLDNEIRWGPDWRGFDTLLQLYLQKGPEAPGKAVAVDLLLEALGGVDEANEALGTSFVDRQGMLDAVEGWDHLAAGSSELEATITTAFLELAADRYFSVATEAVRAADPNHLLLGNREVATLTRIEVWRAAGRHLDVLSINHYTLAEGVGDVALILSGGLDPTGFFEALHTEIDLPMLVSEFGFRAADSGLPNSWPPIYPTYDTQEERASAAVEWMDEAWSTPWVVGAHWFKWQDQPPGGRFDGEDNNWGLVDLQDQPWPEVTAAFEAHSGAWATALQTPAGR